MLTINKKDEFSLIKIHGQKKYEKWLKKYPILNNPDVQSWIRDMIDQYTDEGKDPVKFVVVSYLNPLQQYCTFNQTTNPSLFLKENIDDRNLRLKKYLTFLQASKDKDPIIVKLGFRNGKKPNEVSIRNLLQSRIKSFFSNRGSNISYGLKSRKSGMNINELPITKNILKKIQTKLVSIDYILICKFESQTGLRISDIVEELVSGKYVIEKFKNHYFIRNFETQKEKVTIPFLFFTKELEETLITYAFEYKLNIKNKKKETDLTQINLANLFKTRNGNYIYRNDYLARLKSIIKTLGINGNMKTHGLRKYFITQVDSCKNLNNNFKLILSGHTLPYEDDVYVKTLKNIPKFYEEWIQLEQYLCVDCLVYDKTNKEVLKQKKKIANLEQQLNLQIKENQDLQSKLNLILQYLQKKDDFEQVNNELQKRNNK